MPPKVGSKAACFPNHVKVYLYFVEATPFMFYAAPEEESSWSMHNVESIEADMTLFRNDTKQMVYIGGTSNKKF